MLSELIYEKNTTKLSCYFVPRLTQRPHLHDKCELITCFSGKASCFIGGKNYDIGAGDVVVVFPNQVHDYIMHESGDFLVANFHSDTMLNMGNFFKSYLPERPVINFSESDELKRIMLEFRRFYEDNREDGDLLLLGFLSISMFILKPLLAVQKTEGLGSGNFEKICNYCIRNYRNKISLDILSKELHLSKQRISHIFNQNMNMTLPQYVNFLRISDACRLLTETSDTVTKISEDTGFECLRNFNKAFYEINKMTPREFRRKNR